MYTDTQGQVHMDGHTHTYTGTHTETYTNTQRIYTEPLGEAYTDIVTYADTDARIEADTDTDIHREIHTDIQRHGCAPRAVFTDTCKDRYLYPHVYRTHAAMYIETQTYTTLLHIQRHTDPRHTFIQAHIDTDMHTDS